MTDGQLGIRVGISRNVTRVGKAPGGHVLYQGRRGPLTPEGLVLDRWRHRETPGRVYRGCRLPPATWATLEAIAARSGSLTGLSPDALERELAALRAADASRFWKLPPLGLVPVLIGALARRGVLDDVLRRHGPEGPVDPAHPGVPDLFVWWEEDGTVAGARFVEVKRTKERLARHQRDELLFLRGCGFRAGVVRLREVA